MHQSRSGIVIVVGRLTLLVGGLWTGQILLVLLLVVLIRLRLAILALVRAAIEIPAAASTTTISSRAVVVLHLAPKVVGGSLARLALEDRLREGRRSGRIDTRIGGRVLAIAIEALPGQI